MYQPILLLLVAVLSLHRSATSAGLIVGFQTTIRKPTYTLVQRITDNSVLTADSPTIRAVVLGGPAKVIFTFPYRAVAKKAPYTLPKRGSKEPFVLPPGRHRVVAQIGNDIRTSVFIRVTVTPQADVKHGPLPTGVREIDVPPVPTGCMKEAPEIAITDTVRQDSIQQGFYFNLRYSLSWCAGGRTRVRVMTLYEHKPPGEPRRVITFSRDQETVSQTSDTHTSVIFAAWPTADSLILTYLEACAWDEGKDEPVCATSQLQQLLSRFHATPLLQVRPPPVLRLAPGDKAKVSFRLAAKGATQVGLSAGRHPWDVTKRAVISALLFSKKAQILKSLEPALKAAVVLKFTATKKMNGATAVLRYARSLDVSSTESALLQRYATKIIVSTSVPRLVTQDTAPPTITSQPSFPRVRVGERAVLSVRAVSDGGGKRAGGAPTELLYQWYVRTEKDTDEPAHAEPIPGATGPDLIIEEAECVPFDCDRYGCFQLRIYSVDVCNTFGCTRSKPVESNPRPPVLAPGERWDADTCQVV